ncbi:2-keto-4-pentenoate hydratase [Salinicoccus roseus]|jgi:2-oxo-hept-3-ene-1,7-dioate hydratase|uniref:2-keto-4-pentenoate hydratase n=1 Tax=Salinicoccus roseus TaxID=45670 RepID=UPI000F4DB621|nr:hydratase [Salinicoccus roseus]RPE52813.1 2-oxo-hept-3-ene-1,7-dioate hydratase [Salinicoccus roseus]GGA73239.1 2-keto-4-pentenoate hydratase [Salinicoccus roseus]
MSSVEQLYTAYAANEPLELGVLEIESKEAAYDVQRGVLKLKEENGEVLTGYKISLTSRETQDLFHSDSPLYGAMTDRTVKKEINLNDYNIPLLEMELVFLVDEEILPEDDEAAIMQKCRVAPGAEVPDGRYKDWFPNTSLTEIIADGAVNGAVVYGEPSHYDYKAIEDIKGTLFHEGKAIKEGRSTEVLGHPASAVKWLAGTLAAQGEKLNPGLFISSGTFNLPLPLKTGTYRVEYENVGSVDFRVVQQ